MPRGVNGLDYEAKHNHHIDEYFPASTANTLTLTAGTASNSWTKSQTGIQDGGTHATIMTDSSENMYQLGIMVGDTISNDTDGSTGTITSIGTTTITCSGGLAGGVDNQWENADVWTVSSTDGWMGILDSASNDISDASSARYVYLDSLLLDEISAADKYYQVEVGYGNENGVTTRLRRFFISHTAGTKFEIPAWIDLHSESLDFTKYLYYRLRCETGAATMRGRISFYEEE